MKKIIILSVIFLLLTAPFVTEALKWNPIEPFSTPGGAVEDEVTISEYLSIVYGASIGIAAILAVVMIVIAGIQYTTSAGKESSISSAKSRIWNAIIGLLLVLGAWLFLSTLNPAFVKNTFEVPPIDSGGTVGGGGTSGVGTGGGGTVQPPTGCTNCTNIVAGNLKTKPPGEEGTNRGCAITTATPAGGTCQVSPTIMGRLEQTHDNLGDAGINYQITEMWPPTTSHLNTCHQAGTCVDLAIRDSAGNPTSPNGTTVNGAFTAIKDAGLKPVYEVSTDTRKNELISQGVPEESISVENISGEHFSVYSS